MKSGIKSSLKRTRTSLRSQGLTETVLKSYSIIADHLFDIWYGIDTCKWAELSDLTIHNSVNREKGYPYQPTRLVPLRKLFNVINSIIPPDSVLVDFGCGKGKVLLAASEFGFKEVRGVEFAHELCEIAEKNCAVYKARKGFITEYRIIECDVTDYDINTDENVFFMFNPFDETIMAKVLCRIAASLQVKHRPILVIYYNPKYAHVIEQRDAFGRLREFNFWGYKFTVYSNHEKTKV